MLCGSLIRQYEVGQFVSEDTSHPTSRTLTSGPPIKYTFDITEIRLNYIFW